MLILAGFQNCEIAADPVDSKQEEEKEESTSKLSVMFLNSEDSEYTITRIQTLVMGESGGEMEEPNGDFSENQLPEGESIAPGDSANFEIEMPNLYYAYCNLGVDDGNGNTIILTEQENYPNSYDGQITYWGSDRRQVFVTIQKNNSTGFIRPVSWSEWAY